MKNKFYFVLIILFLTVHSFAQNDLSKLDGYKVIYLPYHFSNTISYIFDKFRSVGFKVYTDESTLKADKDVIIDPGLILTCQVDQSYSYPHTTIGIKLANIKSETLYQRTENTTSKSFVSFDVNKDQKWVIDKLFEPLYSYSFDIRKSLAVVEINNLPVVEMTNWTENSIKSYLSSNNLDPIEGIYKSYQEDRMSYYKIGIIKVSDKFKAIIIESDSKFWKFGEVKAIFEQSSLKGFYSAKWYMANKTPYETFANMENEALFIVELEDPKTGVKFQNKFIKMYPSTSIDIKKDISKASGSGFFITSDGVIATNAHVVEGATNIEITISNEVGTFIYKAKTLLLDTKNDVALLQIEDEKFKGLTSIPYGISEKSDVGEKVFTIGYPLNSVMGSNYKVTDGIISSKSGIADDIRYYQISVPLQPGNSGGPLFNKEGNIIGLTSSRLNGQAIGTKVENVNYAIKSAYLINLYNMLPSSAKLTTTSQVSSKELQDQVKVLKNYVCLIKVF